MQQKTYESLDGIFHVVMRTRDQTVVDVLLWWSSDSQKKVIE